MPQQLKVCVLSPCATAGGTTKKGRAILLLFLAVSIAVVAAGAAVVQSCAQ